MNASGNELDNDGLQVFYPVIINTFYALGAFAMAMLFIPTTRDYFTKAGLKGTDMAKRDRREMYVIFDFNFLS